MPGTTRPADVREQLRYSTTPMTRRSVKREPVYIEGDDMGEVIEVIASPPAVKPGRSVQRSFDASDVSVSDASSVLANGGLPTPSSNVAPSEELFSRHQEFDTESRARRSHAPSAPDGGLQIVGHRVQVLVDAISDFKKFGVQHVVQLPELVLVGDQSAGKSSLMGALAEIHLPRSAGCCTRCPAYIKTAESDRWSCKISLQQEYSYSLTRVGRPLSPRDVTTNNPFPPWREGELIVKHFKTVYDKGELEEALKWAQIATLNYNKSHALYVPGSDTFTADESTEAKFSPNVVCIEISGPGLVPLSFYDLPGIFQSTGHKEDQYLVKVIENLATKYIKHSQALIICALPMSADPATSRTIKVISDQHAEGRCIGVLTKADRLQDGQAHADFERMLRGEEHVVGHGYYVTKLPGESVGWAYDEHYHARARIEEENFFETERPWAAEWVEFHGRFGTTKLAHALSQKFAAQIVQSIPDIEEKIKVRAMKIDDQLDALPELPSRNILHVVLQRLSAFSTNFRAVLEGGATRNDFQGSWRKLCDEFREAILEMKPRINVRDESDDGAYDVINLDDDDDDDLEMLDGTPNERERKRQTDDPQSPSPSKKTRTNDAIIKASPSHSTMPKMSGGLPTRPLTPRALPDKVGVEEAPNPFAKYRDYGKNFASIGAIRREIARYSRTGIPGIVNEQVHMEYCMQSVTPWEGPLEVLLDLTLSKLRDLAKTILFQELSRWQQTQLFKQAHEHLCTFFDGFEVNQRNAVADLYSLETYKLFTVNNIALAQYRQEELDRLKHARRNKRLMAYVKSYIKNFESMHRKTLTLEQRKRIEKDVTDEKLGKDSFETEIEVAAYIRGYYRTAALRFTDNVCLSINGKLFREAREKIFYFLERSLELNQGNAEERCTSLMEEDAATASRRAALRTEKENLQKFKERLLQLARDERELAAANPVAAVIPEKMLF